MDFSSQSYVQPSLHYALVAIPSEAHLLGTLATVIPLRGRGDVRRRHILVTAASVFVAYQLALGFFILLTFYQGVGLVLVVGSQALLMLLVAYFTPRQLPADPITDRAPDTSPHP